MFSLLSYSLVVYLYRGFISVKETIATSNESTEPNGNTPIEYKKNDKVYVKAVPEDKKAKIISKYNSNVYEVEYRDDGRYEYVDVNILRPMKK
jgi:hypothetical protein